MFMSSKPTAIVFDFGGVLLEWDPRHLYRKLFNGNHQGMEYFLTTICTLEWNRQMDLGKPFAEAVGELARQYPEYADLIYAYRLRWDEMVPGPYEDTVEILAAVHRAGYPIYALSNWSAETFPIIRQRYEFLSWFDDIVISGALKQAKPEPQIYESLLDRIGRPAAECLFIDDSEANIQTATDLGFQTILFRSAPTLLANLQAQGILAKS